MYESLSDNREGFFCTMISNTSTYTLSRATFNAATQDEDGNKKAHLWHFQTGNCTLSLMNGVGGTSDGAKSLDASGNAQSIAFDFESNPIGRNFTFTFSEAKAQISQIVIKTKKLEASLVQINLIGSVLEDLGVNGGSNQGNYEDALSKQHNGFFGFDEEGTDDTHSSTNWED